MSYKNVTDINRTEILLAFQKSHWERPRATGNVPNFARFEGHAFKLAMLEMGPQVSFLEGYISASFSNFWVI